MKSSTAVAASIALSAAALALVAPGASAAVAPTPCVPTISMDQPFQDPGGFVVFPATYSTCDNSIVTIKFRDRDTTSGWGSSAGSVAGGTTASTASGTCQPDGSAHRWVAYATIKTASSPRQLVAASQKVWLKSSPVKGNCAPLPR